FQRKCLGKMSEVEKTGRTVLFVSHNMDAMARLCPRTIRLESGSIVADGSTHGIVRDYLRSTAVESAAITFEDDQGLRAHIRTVWMSSGGSAATTRFSSGDSATV